MIGNSPRSDILPVLEMGGHAFHVPFHTTWVHEVVDEEDAIRDAYAHAYTELSDIRQLPELMAAWVSAEGH